MSSPDTSEPESDSTAFVRTLAIATLALLATIYALYFARAFCVPIALALFFNTLFRPAVRRLETLRIPSALGAAIVVLGFLSVMAAGIALVWTPAQQWVEAAPGRLNAVEVRVRKIVRPLERVSAAADQIGNAGASETGTTPVTVQPVKPTGLTQLFGATATYGAMLTEVVVLLYLLLASGGMFLERLISVIPGRADKRTAVHIANEVETAVSHYLRTTALINIAQATVVGLALWALGMPDPIFWVALTFVLEFIPYLGALMMVVLLTFSSLSTFDSVGHALAVPLAYLVISALQNNVASPLLYGRRLKLNPVALLVAVVFWGYIWGVAGTLMAVPILAATKILCDHLAPLESLGKFLEA